MKTLNVPTVTIPESYIQKQILDYLKTKGHFCWRNNTGQFSGDHKGKKWFVRAGKVGSGDIIGLRKPNGQFFSIEVKREGKKASDEQLQFMIDVNENGGLAFVAYSVEDAVANGL